MNLVNTIRSAIKHWWAFLIIGITLSFLGLMVVRHPGESYLALNIYFSIALFVTGLSQTAFAISNRNTMKGWGWYLAGGILEIVLGLVLLTHPRLSMAVLPVVVGIWLMFRGFSLIGISTDMRGLGLKNWGWFLAAGILTAVFSFFIIVNPFVGMITIVTWTALATFIAGGINFYLAYQLRKIGEDIQGAEKDITEVEQEFARLKA